MGWLDTDISFRRILFDGQPGTLPLASTTAVPAHQLLPFAISITSIPSSAVYCNRPEPDMWSSQAQLAQCVGLLLVSRVNGVAARIFQRHSCVDQCAASA